MLSLSESWDYTTKGLSKICKDGIDSICATIKELEAQGYIERKRVRNSKGQLTTIEYTILEQPKPPISEQVQPKRENPVLDKPILGKPEQENPHQLNTKGLNTNQLLINQSFIQRRERTKEITPLAGIVMNSDTRSSTTPCVRILAGIAWMKLSKPCLNRFRSGRML